MVHEKLTGNFAGFPDVEVPPFDEGRTARLREIGVDSEFAFLYNMALLQLDDEIDQEKKASYGLDGPADFLRLILQTRRAEEGETPSWGDYNQQYLEMVASEYPVPQNALLGEIGIGPSGRGIENLISAFSDNGEFTGRVVGIDQNYEHIDSAAARLTKKGFDVDIIDARENQEAVTENLVNRSKEQGKIYLVCGDAKKVLPAMAGKFDILVADKVMQHLDNKNSPKAMGEAINTALKKKGRLVVLDLMLAHPQDGWLAKAAEGFEKDKAVIAALAFHEEYMQKIANPAWDRRGASRFASPGEIEHLVAENTGFTTVAELTQEFDSGECREPNSFENVIAATMPAAIATGYERGLRGVEAALKDLPDGHQKRIELDQKKIDLTHAVMASKALGKRYVEEVVLNPKVIVNMPRLAGLTFVKNS